ncbi:MAG: two-component sensor histidine kinase [Lachnospiraceae bacterium]|nr:two-component sensor histidine kinase [Lachnospiraceae bacterium]
MKKKINSRLVMTAIVGIVSTMLLITVVYYDLFCRQIMEDLKTYVSFMVHLSLGEELHNAESIGHIEGLHVTLVDNTGHIIYDNGKGHEEKELPEVEAAFADGEGQAIRKSLTLDRSTFYYAVRLGDGSVLRVGRESESLYSIFVSALPSLVMVTCILIVVSMVLAHVLTGNLIKPIERLAENLEEQEELTEYEELVPLINMIQEQHKDIIKNARIRQDFTANVSHELKTPLTSISGYAELIENGMASEADTVRFAGGIRKSATRLLTLINDIIRLSELDSTEQTIVFEKLNLYQLAETCVEMLSMNAEKHHVTISLQGMESYINGNRQMIEELLYNLCDNAIRYNNENGTVKVTVYQSQKQTILVVRDTGIGIPSEHRERIFERFYRVDKSRSKSTGGTGLGLAIVKHILVKHHASIDLQSELGKGTVMTVTFPEIENGFF